MDGLPTLDEFILCINCEELEQDHAVDGKCLFGFAYWTPLTRERFDVHTFEMGNKRHYCSSACWLRLRTRPKKSSS